MLKGVSYTKDVDGNVTYLTVDVEFYEQEYSEFVVELVVLDPLFRVRAVG